MTTTEKKRLIQLVKIGQKQLNICDEDYRAMLKRLTNKTSSTKCTLLDLHKVIHELQQKGAKIAWFPRKKMTATDYSPATGEQAVKSEIAHKIRAIWIQMGRQGFLADRSEKALNHFIRKILNKGRDNIFILAYVHTLSDKNATRIVEALKSWHKRLMLAELAQNGIQLGNAVSYNKVSTIYEQQLRGKA